MHGYREPRRHLENNVALVFLQVRLSDVLSLWMTGNKFIPSNLVVHKENLFLFPSLIQLIVRWQVLR